MCEALERLMADVIEEQVNQKIEEARIENIRKIMKAFCFCRTGYGYSPDSSEPSGIYTF